MVFWLQCSIKSLLFHLTLPAINEMIFLRRFGVRAMVFNITSNTYFSFWVEENGVPVPGENHQSATIPDKPNYA
jgi:hypothetical protein